MKPLYFDCSPGMAAALTPELLATCPALEVRIGAAEKAELPALLRGRDIVVLGNTVLDAADLAALPDLRHLVFLGTGASSYVDLAAAAARGIAVHVVPGYGNQAVAEHALALMFACARRVAAMDRAIRAGGFPSTAGVELAGATFGVVGTGPIGATTARLAAAIGMRVIAWNRSGVDPAIPARTVALDDLFAEADVVSLHVALTPETRGLVDSRRLARMKPGSILVNTARGALVDEAALVAALDAGRPGAAGLDVFEREPLQPDHPLRRHEAVTLTGHAAFRTPAASRRLIEGTFAIVNRLLAAD
jgi:D-3-phosphoglycerate dehydrogenase